MSNQWPHAPLHLFEGTDHYIVTAGTLHRRHFLSTPRHLDLAWRIMSTTFDEYAWDLQSWSIFSNHYHAMPVARRGAGSLAECLERFHNRCSKEINELDGMSGRQLWYQYWDTRLTYQKSWLARMKYVVFNPVKHGLVSNPEDYPWCSARWLAETASRAFYRTVMSLHIDRVNVLDDWTPSATRRERGALECGASAPLSGASAPLSGASAPSSGASAPSSAEVVMRFGGRKK